MKIIQPRTWFNVHNILFFFVAVCFCTALLLQASNPFPSTTAIGPVEEASLVLEFRLSFGRRFQGSSLSGCVSVKKDDSYEHVRGLAIDSLVNKGFLDRSFLCSFKFKMDDDKKLFSGSGVVDDSLIASLREYKDSGRQLYAVVEINRDE